MIGEAALDKPGIWGFLALLIAAGAASQHTGGTQLSQTAGPPTHARTCFSRCRRSSALICRSLSFSVCVSTRRRRASTPVTTAPISAAACWCGGGLAVGGAAERSLLRLPSSCCSKQATMATPLGLGACLEAHHHAHCEQRGARHAGLRPAAAAERRWRRRRRHRHATRGGSRCWPFAAYMRRMLTPLLQPVERWARARCETRADARHTAPASCGQPSNNIAGCR